MTHVLPPTPRLTPSLDLEQDLGFQTVRVRLAPLVKSYRNSLFAFEWLTPDGMVKTVDQLAVGPMDARRAVEQAFQNGDAVPQPVVGWGMLDCVEIGAGRDVVLTAYALGVQDLMMHVSTSALDKMKDMIVAEHPSERGNILLYILICIVLLAALSYAVSNSTRSGSTGFLSDGQESALATEILTYANHVKTAVAKLNLRGCTDDQLNFDNDVVAGYTNAGAPSDDSCDLFAPTGGALTWVTPAAEVTASPWFYSGRVVVHQDSGFASSNSADDADLVMMLMDIPSGLCAKINTKFGVSGVPVDDGSFADTTKFQGAFAYAEDINGLPEGAQPSPCGSPSTAANFCGRDAGCFREESGSQRYIFFQVLKQR
jgi:hypothetical protein